VMTPFWRPLIRVTLKPQCKWEANCHMQPSPKFFMYQNEKNLISDGFKVEFDKYGCKVNDARGVVVVET